MLTVTLVIWLKAQEERPARAASTDATVTETPASEGRGTPVVSSSPTPAGVGSMEGSPIWKLSRIVEGVPFSFSVPTDGWEEFGKISINKSRVGPQGAEAMIFWTSFPDGDRADPCAHLLSQSVGQSAVDLAAAVATAPGTELVTGPSIVALDGRSAKHVELTVLERVGCDPGFFYTWRDIPWGALWPRTHVGDTIRVWIVDVDGTRLFIEAETTKQAGVELEQEVEQIVESIRFD